MAPPRRTIVAKGYVLKPDTPGRATMGLLGDIAEGWAEGYQVGAMIILILVVLCNLRRGVLLHKLILIEQICAIPIGFTIYWSDPKYGWWFSGCMFFLYCSYFLHNLVSWLKIRAFLKPKLSLLFIGSLLVVQAYWIFALYTVYLNWNGLPHNHYKAIRAWECAMREPWWVFTAVYLILIIKRGYQHSMRDLFRTSNRFIILIVCIVCSLVFVTLDLIVTAGNLLAENGINPFWHLALVFKCASDTIFLDDFQTVLDALVEQSLNKARGGHSYGTSSARSNNGLRRSTTSTKAYKLTSQKSPIDEPKQAWTGSWRKDSLFHLPAFIPRSKSERDEEAFPLSSSRREHGAQQIERGVEITVSSEHASHALPDDRNDEISTVIQPTSRMLGVKEETNI